MSHPIVERLNHIRSSIENACILYNRDPQEVTLLAVSKTKPMADLEAAYANGQRDFGENYAQEAVEKYDNAVFKEGIWHFIGPLQSNKTRPIAERYDWVHTVDRLKIAQRLSDQRPTAKKPLNVLIQVNISNDPAKAGVLLSQVSQFAEQVSELANLSLRGLMAIPANGLSSDELANQYAQLKLAQTRLLKAHPNCTELSIGMSGDYKIAIAQGATFVRIGSDIFGQRA